MARRNTGPEADRVIHKITTATVAERRAVRDVQAAVYGHTGGPAIVVKGARWSSPAIHAEESDPVSFDKGYARGVATSSGATDLRSFPAGPLGGALYCGHGRSGEIVCGWTEKVRLGSVDYFYGAAPSLSDAASKTNQIRAAIEP